MRFQKWILVTACLLAGPGAWADAAGDFKAGDAAFRRGDLRGAITALKRGAEQGHAPSQAMLGQILDASEQNEEAVKYFRMAAEQGDAAGLFGLATMYATGEGVARDQDKARELMTKAAEAGHEQAAHTLAVAYLKGGLGIPDSERASPTARKWIEAAAASGYVDAIDRMALAYRQGQYGLEVDLARAGEYEARAKALRKQPAPTKGGKGKKASG